MLALLFKAIDGDPSAISGVAALVTIIAVIPSALLFVLNQIYQNRVFREYKHRYIAEQYDAFLGKCLEQSDLRLESGDPIPVARCSDDQLFRRDIMFELLTTMFERAYLAYANRFNSSRSQQWEGWEKYISDYAQRVDYQDWWIRVVFGGDPSSRPIGITQYDLRFEAYILAKLGPTLDLSAAPVRGRRRSKNS